MNLRLLMAATGLLMAAGVQAQQANVGITIDGPPLPGLFGRVQIGANLPLPPVYLPKPIIVAPPQVVVSREPVYLWVPHDHRRDWKRHCGRYDACGRPVYFVEERWVREHEPQRFEKKRGRGRGDDDHPGRGHGKGHGKDKDHDKGRGRD